MFWALFSSRETSSALPNLHDSSVRIHQILYLFLDYSSFAYVLLLPSLEIQNQMGNLLVKDSL